MIVIALPEIEHTHTYKCLDVYASRYLVEYARLADRQVHLAGIQSDRQTGGYANAPDGQTVRQSDRQKSKCTRQANRQTGRQADSQIGRQADRQVHQTGRSAWSDSQTDGQTDREFRHVACISQLCGSMRP